MFPEIAGSASYFHQIRRSRIVIRHDDLQR